MQSLLRWGIENSTPQTQTQTQIQPKPLDPSIIDIILGKSDAERMKDALAIAVSVDKVDVDDRVNALDDLEMLVEQIDNANNLEKLNMWEPLHGLLTPTTPTPDFERIRTHAIWVIGTAVQNNPAAQDAYLKLNPIPLLTSFLAPPPKSTTSKETRSKAIYALSGLLKHNAPALKQLDVQSVNGDGIEDGWDRLRQALQHAEITIRRKTVFLFNNLLTPNEAFTPSLSSQTQTQNLHTPDALSHPQDPIHPNSHSAYLSHPNRASTSGPTFEAMQTHGIVRVLVDSLTGADEGQVGGGVDADLDLDFEEKGVTLLRTYLQLNGPLNQSQKDRIRRWIVRSAAAASTTTTSITSAASAASGGESGDFALSSGSGSSSGFENLAERWGMNVTELEELVKMVRVDG
ncbi:nucleotide exchange factor Fes1-domain-containing protein [Lentinula aff. detonsa]|uniref:Nucleotide exchange factor Fes1-domain-containing protein n=1 Tax=Lentinula aff. detonsa TaxID=2804958 RepID=A0AA38L369_9AGAR|nr:nucleotide exchange factor Fes1-domain-containing protein [Lentinula aff. detonsa]